MNVREHLLALTDELRRLKAEGSRTVSINLESMAELRRAVEVARVELTATTPANVAAPVEAQSSQSTQRAEPAQAFAAAAFAAPPPVRVVVASSAPALGTPPPITLPAGDKHARWSALREIVLGDPTCKSRVFAGKQIVFGVGNLDASVMFIGEAPGADEEEQGEPFVGRAGQLLNRMIKAMGLDRSQVYIGNILNWRPEMGARSPDGFQTGNRPPTQDEMAYCLPFIRAQIEIIQPRVLVALGKTAVDGLLGAERFKTMGAARGAWHTYNSIPLRATYHPSYLLRQEGLRSEAALKIKRDAWEDLLAVMEKAELPISEKQRSYFKTA